MDENVQYAYVPELEPGSQELAITKIIYNKLSEQDCLASGNRESVAYRLAEIMTSAQELYMDYLPHLIDSDRSQNISEEEAEFDEHAGEAPIFREILGVRMALIHLRDLIADFDEAFIEAMSREHEDGEGGDTAAEDDFFEEY